jgi:plastocyanin
VAIAVVEESTTSSTWSWHPSLLDTDPHAPSPDSVRITFTKPGTYDYECVIHPDMDGTIALQIIERLSTARSTRRHR